jgi:hypothetical protein
MVAVKYRHSLFLSSVYGSRLGFNESGYGFGFNESGYGCGFNESGYGSRSSILSESDPN